MALTPLQRRVCRALAEERKRSGESYVAGGAALNEVVPGARLSRDIDVFHDTASALEATVASDRDVLQAAGFRVETTRAVRGLTEARVGAGDDSVLVQWVQDSAYRYFPLMEHDVFGLTLHPLDLATNKLLAVVGRHVARDWVDILESHAGVQPLGYLAWAAAGKDPGLSPLWIVETCARTRYAQAELDVLEFDGPPPRAADLSQRWHHAVEEARRLVRALPAEQLGTCVLDGQGRLQRAGPAALEEALANDGVRFHRGTIRGAFPEIVSGDG